MINALSRVSEVISPDYLVDFVAHIDVDPIQNIFDAIFISGNIFLALSSQHAGLHDFINFSNDRCYI